MIKNILIVGYYGYSNSGDDAILSSICDDINLIDPSITIGILSQNPAQTEKEYGIKAYKRFSLIQVIKSIHRTDLLLMGGGSLLQDETSSRSIYYYLFILKLAQLFKKKIMLYANGIGPIHKSFNKKLTSRIINRVDLITLREKLSLHKLEEMKVNQPKIVVTADPVFNLTLAERSIKEIVEKYSLFEEYVVVMIRPWKDKEAYTEKITSVCDYLIRKHNKQVVFIPMRYPGDLSISKEIVNKLQNRGLVIDELLNANDIAGLIKGSQLVISMRLHALIYAAIQGIPMIGLEYDPKVAYYLNVIDMPSGGDILNLDVDKVQKVIDDIFDHYHDYQTKLKINTGKMIEAATENKILLENLIKES